MHRWASIYKHLVYLCGRLSYNKLAADCAGAVFYAMMKHALDTAHSSTGELRPSFHCYIIFFPLFLSMAYVSYLIKTTYRFVLEFEHTWKTWCLDLVRETE